MSHIFIYTDGSYRASLNKHCSGWGFVVIENDEIIEQKSGVTNDFICSRQIAGETKAVIEALKYCYENNISKVMICYDYTGIKEWAIGNWQTSSPVAQNYILWFDKIVKNYFVKYGKRLNVSFKHIKGHSGNRFNDFADKLASQAIKDYVKELRNDKES